VGLAVAGLNFSALAAPPSINGSVSFAGIPAANGPMAAATAITNFTHVTIIGGQESGSYSNVPGGAAASWMPFTFSPPAADVAPLWALTNTGVIYSFDATSMSVVYRDSTFLNIQGTGIAHITGFADTPGTWSFGASQVGASFTFGASTPVSATNVPVLQSVTQTNGTLAFEWNALSGQPYQVEYTTNLTSPGWNALGGPIITTNPTATTSDPIGPGGQRFYRVSLLP